LGNPNATKIQFENDADGRPNGFRAKNAQEAVEEINFRSLVKEPTGFPNRTDSAITWNNTLRQVYIAPTGSSFDYYIRGVKYTVTATQTATITDTEGGWYIYFNGDTLTASQTLWGFEDAYAFVAFMLWDATNKKFIFPGEERHGLAMDWATHVRLHFVDHTQVEDHSFDLQDFVSRGDGSSDDHARIGLSEGVIHDEDIRMSVTNSATPSEYFEQKLNPIAWIPIYYKLGTVWRKMDATQFPMIYDGVNPIQYNLDTGGVWSLENASENFFVETWLFATDNMEEPIIGIVGQRQLGTTPTLLPADLNQITSGLPFAEFNFIHKLVFRTTTAYTNTPKASLYLSTSIVVLAADRYGFEAQLPGNAGSGKFIDAFAGIGSDEDPYPIHEDSYIRSVSIKVVSSTTGVMGFYRHSDLTTPVFSVTLTASDYVKVLLSELFLEDEAITIKAISGSFSKPAVKVMLQTVVNEA